MSDCSDEEEMDDVNGIDLEAKEQRLRLLNEQLDQRREQIVERAEKLLNKQKDFLKNSVQETAQSVGSENDNEMEDIIHSTADILKIEEPEPIHQDTHSEEVDEMPRTQIPQKMNRKEAKTTKREESKTPDV